MKNLEHMPATCPYGHPLKAASVTVGWVPCDCAPALARHRGHRWHICRACHDDGYTTVAYFPYHVPAEGAAIRWP